MSEKLDKLLKEALDKELSTAERADWIVSQTLVTASQKVEPTNESKSEWTSEQVFSSFLNNALISIEDKDIHKDITILKFYWKELSCSVSVSIFRNDGSPPFTVSVRLKSVNVSHISRGLDSIANLPNIVMYLCAKIYAKHLDGFLWDCKPHGAATLLIDNIRPNSGFPYFQFFAMYEKHRL